MRLYHIGSTRLCADLLPLIASAQGYAVIALPPRDDELPLRLATSQKILPRQLQRGFDRFRAAAYEQHI